MNDCRAGLTESEGSREERRYLYEPAKPVPVDWKQVGQVRHGYEVGLEGEWFWRYSFLPEGETLRDARWVEMRQVEQRRFVTEWENVDGD